MGKIQMKDFLSQGTISDILIQCARKIRPEDHRLASRGTDFSIPSSHEKWILFPAYHLVPHFIFGKKTDMEKASGNPELAEMRHGDVILTLQLRHRTTCGSRADDVRLFVFYLSHGLVRVHVCEIESFHMCKQNGNSDLVCEKIHFRMRITKALIRLCGCCTHAKKTARFSRVEARIVQYLCPFQI